MTIPTHVNAQIIDTVKQSQNATIHHHVVRVSGAGKAYQSVAQSAALAVQDAVDELRNMATLSTTATGVALAQMLACPAVGANTEPYTATIKQAHSSMTSATQDFKNISQAAGQLLAFPTGFEQG